MPRSWIAPSLHCAKVPPEPANWQVDLARLLRELGWVGDDRRDLHALLVGFHHKRERLLHLGELQRAGIVFVEVAEEHLAEEALRS